MSGWLLDRGEGSPATETLNKDQRGSSTTATTYYRRQALAEGEAADRPDMRPFMLCRSGGPGIATIRRDPLVWRNQRGRITLTALLTAACGSSKSALRWPMNC
jgi:hypothetical protein